MLSKSNTFPFLFSKSKIKLGKLRRQEKRQEQEVQQEIVMSNFRHQPI